MRAPSPTTSCSAQAPTISSSLRRARSRARAIASRSSTSRPTPSTASPPGSRGQRSAALAVAVLAEPSDVRFLLEERERFAAGLRELGLEPLPSATNFLYVPYERARELSEVILGEGMVVRAYPDAIRVTVLDRPSN